jgi:hypothetical protein
MALSSYSSSGLLKKQPLLGSSYMLTDPEGVQEYMTLHKEAVAKGGFTHDSDYEKTRRATLQEEIRTGYDTVLNEDPKIIKSKERLDNLMDKYETNLRNIETLEAASRGESVTPEKGLNKALKQLNTSLASHNRLPDQEVYTKLLTKYQKIAAKQGDKLFKSKQKHTKLEDKKVSKEEDLWTQFNRKTEILNRFFG